MEQNLRYSKPLSDKAGVLSSGTAEGNQHCLADIMSFLSRYLCYGLGHFFNSDGEKSPGDFFYLFIGKLGTGSFCLFKFELQVGELFYDRSYAQWTFEIFAEAGWKMFWANPSQN